MNKANLLTVKEVAKYLSVHEITVYRLLKQNKIPALRIGGQWRFDIDSIRSWLKIRGTKTEATPAAKKSRRQGIPKSLWKYFWDVDAAKLNLAENGNFVLERLLEYGDIDAVEWLKKRFTKDEIKDMVMHSQRLSPRSANYWRLILNIDKEAIFCLRKPSQQLQGRIWRY